MFHVSHFTHFYVPCVTLHSFPCSMCRTSLISMFHVSHFTHFHVPCVTLHSFLCSMCRTSLIFKFHVSQFAHFYVPCVALHSFLCFMCRTSLISSLNLSSIFLSILILSTLTAVFPICAMRLICAIVAAFCSFWLPL